jgi:hypothetical protein
MSDREFGGEFACLPMLRVRVSVTVLVSIILVAQTSLKTCFGEAALELNCCYNGCHSMKASVDGCVLAGEECEGPGEASCEVLRELT